MKDLFYHNWDVRDQWINWCKEISSTSEINEETSREFNNIIKTLYDLIYTEQYWISRINGVQKLIRNDTSNITLEIVIEYSTITRPYIKKIIEESKYNLNDTVMVMREDGTEFNCPFSKIFFHVIFNEVHQVGQLSIRARRLGFTPVESELIDTTVLVD
jgi:uncharacterized damage-inducible protein DinB